MSEQDNGHVSTLQRPTTDDPDGWRAYWKAQGWPWRTKPEIDIKRQEELAQCRAIVPDIEKGKYPFKDMRLSRADVEWLLATHESGGIRGPVDWSDENQREREGLDLRGADLHGSDGQRVNLSRLPLARLRGSNDRWNLTKNQMMTSMIKMDGVSLEDAHLEGAILSGITLKNVFLRNAHLQKANLSKSKLLNVKMRRAQLAGADLSSIYLENAFLPSAQFMDANLSNAQLIDVNVSFSRFDRACLIGVRLERVDLKDASFKDASLARAILKEVNLEKAQFQGADLSEVQLEAVKLREITLSGKEYIGPLLADVQWEHTNLTVVDWSQVKILGDEHEACQKNGEDGGFIYPKSKDIRIREYQVAVRANRQLAVALQAQGLNEDASRFAYRAQKLQRIVLRLQRKIGSYLFSVFLDLLAGYGYRPGRSVIWYLVTIFGFALVYFAIGHLPFFPDAFVFSLTSFHGRGFFPGLGSENSLHNPLVIMAAFEAVVGLLIEISFIATFTQRFFGR